MAFMMQVWESVRMGGGVLGEEGEIICVCEGPWAA